MPSAYVSSCCAALALVAVTATAQLPDRWTIDRLQQTLSVEAVEEVAVTNPHGDLRCRGTEESEILVLALIQQHEGDPYRAEVVVERAAGRLAIEVVWQPRDDSAGDELTEEMARRRVDLTVLLPDGPRLAARTESGLLEAKVFGNDLEASSVSGRVRLQTAGTVRARSEHGELEVTLDATEWAVPPHLETLTGDVTLWLAPGTDAIVEAETEGILSTDYSLEIVERFGGGRRKRARALVGDGDGRLSVASVKGQIRLLRQFG